MHQFFFKNGNLLFQFFQIIILPTFLVVIILLTCTKQRKPRTESKSGKNPQKIVRQTHTPTNTTMTKTEDTRDRGSAPTVSGTPQIPGQGHQTSKLNKKSIKSPRTKKSNNNNKTSKRLPRSKREKSKEEKTKKESNFKKFMHKLGGNSEKNSKTHSNEEAAAPEGGQNDENEKLPYSSRKARRRKTIGDNLKTAEDNGDNTQAEEDPKIVDPIKVVQMGNIDIITQQERNRRIREIEQMPSDNLCEDATQLSKSIKKENMHVKIVETNCKLYETNAEPMTRSHKESIRKRKKIKHQLRPRSKGSDTK